MALIYSYSITVWFLALSSPTLSFGYRSSRSQPAECTMTILSSAFKTDYAKAVPVYEGKEIRASCQCLPNVSPVVWSLNSNVVEGTYENISVEDKLTESILRVNSVSREQEGSLCCCQNSSCIRKCVHFQVVSLPVVKITFPQCLLEGNDNDTEIAYVYIECTVSYTYKYTGHSNMLLLQNNADRGAKAQITFGNYTDAKGRTVSTMAFKFVLPIPEHQPNMYNYSCEWVQDDGTVVNALFNSIPRSCPLPTRSTTTVQVWTSGVSFSSSAVLPGSGDDTLTETIVIAIIVIPITLVIITFMVLFIYKLRRFRLLKENSDSEYLNVHDKESNEEPDNPPLTTTTACAAKLKSFTEVPGVDACALSTNVEEQNSRFASESDPIGSSLSVRAEQPHCESDNTDNTNTDNDNTNTGNTTNGTDTGSPSDETTQEKVLRSLWTTLIDNLDPELIIDDLYREKVIDKRVLERIRYGHGNFRQDKAKDLLSVMQQSSVEAVKRFAEILSQASLLKDLGEQLLQAIEIENTSMLRIEQEEESRSPVSPLGTDHATETRNARTVECENDCPETGGDNPPLTTTTACAAKLKSFTEVPGVDARALSTNVEEQNSRFASESDPIGKLTITVGPEGRSVRNGSMSLDIPRGAVEEFVILSSHLYIDKCKLPPVDTAKDEYLFSPVLTLYPQGYQFKKPVSVKFPFNAVASDWLLVLLRENCQTSNTDSTWKEVVVYDTDTGTVNTTDCSYDVFEASLTISRFYDHCWLGKPLKDCLLKCRKLIYCSAFGFQKPHENLNIWVLEVIMHDQCDDLFNNIESKQRQKIPRRLWFDGPAVLQIGLHDVVTCTLKAASWQTDEPEKTLSAAHFWSALFGNENRFLYELILRSDFGKDDDAGMVVNVSTSSDTTPIHLNIDPPLGEPQISSSTGPSILLGDHEFGISTANYVKAKQRTSVARKIASHWEELAALLAPHFFTVHKLAEIKRQYTCSLVSQANAMLDMWSDLFDKQATCRVLIRALLDIGWKEVAVEVFSPLLVELVELHCRETYT